MEEKRKTNTKSDCVVKFESDTETIDSLSQNVADVKDVMQRSLASNSKKRLDDESAMKLLERAYNYLTEHYSRYEFDTRYHRMAYQVKIYGNTCYAYIAYTRQTLGIKGQIVSEFKVFTLEDCEGGA